jgi:hypothetical protein
MVEQFRVNAMRMEQSQREALIKARIEAFMKTSGDMREMFIGTAEILSDYLGVYKITIVHLNAGNATAFSNIAPPYDFPAHGQVEELLGERKIAFLNTQAIAGRNLDFIDPMTVSVCLTPIKKETLLGYIIFENGVHAALSESNELTVMYISEILSEWLSDAVLRPDKARGGEPAAAENNAELITDKIRLIEGIDVDAALSQMGGLGSAYVSTVRLFARLLPETIAKMDGYISEGDLNGFTTEIHGIKGVLKSIGAVKLGSDASLFENAA